MNKQHSWARRWYEDSYEKMRRGITFEDLIKHWHAPEEIIKAADYSYQARDYYLHGWSNDRRRIRFHQIVWRILTQREELPF